MNEQKMQVAYEFGSFRVDTLKRQLFRDGVPLPLTSKAFETLAILLANHGATVAKPDLMNSVWGDTAVEENNLTQQISALRKAFGERASDHKFIVTVPGRGYCFVAPIRPVAAEMADSSRDTASDNNRAGNRRSVFAWLVDSSFIFGHGLAIVYVLAVCIPAFFLDWQRGVNTSKPQSIAIMQFRSAGIGDELLGMGIRDTLRAKLGSLDDVAVRPDTVDLPPDDIVDAGRRMHVDVVLTGSIQRDEDRVRVAIEIVDVSNERIMWGNTFDDTSSNAFDLQDSIAAAVLNALHRPRTRSAVRNIGLPSNGSPLLAERFTPPFLPLRKEDHVFSA
jgi:DNA-binding winged helix-turn-helix (wHTH) protein/TolB-like protein